MGEPCDATVSFDSIEFYNGIVQLLCHSTAFLYRLHQWPFTPISQSAIYLLKLHTARWFSPPWHKITPIVENHGTPPVTVTATVIVIRDYLTALINVAISVHAYVRYSLVSNWLLPIIRYFPFIQLATIIFTRCCQTRVLPCCQKYFLVKLGASPQRNL